VTEAPVGRRRDAAAAAWNLRDEVVLVAAGDPVPVPGRYDRTYPFRSHSEYFWLTDRERPGGVLAFDPGDGWIEFVPPVTPEELLWSGSDGLQEGPVSGTESIADLDAWVATRAVRETGRLGAAFAGSPLDKRLREALTHVRRVKDESELERMRAAERATQAGFRALAGLIEPGRTERALQIELEAEFLRAGADATAFDTIVAGGPHAAVLHFAPTTRPLAAGELVLVDAGGEVKGYVSDVTRTYPVTSFSEEQRVVYAIVARALRTATAACRPGVEWRDVHRAAALVIAEGLVDLGVLRGRPESLFEQGAVTLFFPHGVGHMVGLGVRDAGGQVSGREPLGPAFPSLRVDLPLEAGYAMTVEPGLYFVPPLLDRDTRERFRVEIDWDRADALSGLGGVRLEDNIVVTDAGCDVLTAGIPLLD
jgi:Xaa-Pro aminopeptidase